MHIHYYLAKHYRTWGALVPTLRIFHYYAGMVFLFPFVVVVIVFVTVTVTVAVILLFVFGGSGSLLAPNVHAIVKLGALPTYMLGEIHDMSFIFWSINWITMC